MSALAIAKSLTIPVDPARPVRLGRGYDSFTGILRGDAVLAGGQNQKTIGGGQQPTYTIRAVTSAGDLKAWLGVPAAGSFERLWGPVDARAGFVGSLRLHRYRTYLLVHCTVEQATTMLESLDVNDEVKAFVGTDSPDMSRFYDKWGDTFVASYVTGGELIGLVELQTESDEAQASLAAQIDAVGGSWSAASDFRAQIEKLPRSTEASVAVYANGTAGPVASVDQMVAAVRSFPDEVDPAKGGQPRRYSIVVMDYDAALPVGAHGPSLYRADQLLERYGELSERLSLAANSLAYVVQHKERFRLSEAEIRSLQNEIKRKQDLIDSAVSQIRVAPVDTGAAIPDDLESAVEQIEAGVPAPRPPSGSASGGAGAYPRRSGPVSIVPTEPPAVRHEGHDQEH
jgi:hypothetical protein